MRILWLTNDFPPRAGGIQQFVLNLVRRIDPGQAVVLAPRTSGSAGFDAAEPCDIWRLPARVVLPTPWTLRRVREAARRHGPDVIVLGAAWPLGELARHLGKDPGVPVVSLTHGLEAGLASVGAGALVRRATRGLAAVTTISDYTERELVPHLRASRSARVSPGVDVASFRPDLDGSVMRRAWGIPEVAPLVGCISRLVRRKGQDVLLAAWPEIARAVPDAHLVIAGDGPLARRLQRAGEQRAHVVGALRWDELPTSFAALDVFAMPCRTRLFGADVEGLGIAALEAQASGVPAIVGRSGGAPETVVSGTTGLIVDGRDRQAIATAVIDLLEDRERRDAMGMEARRWAEERWSWETIAGDLRDVLQAVIDRSA